MTSLLTNLFSRSVLLSSRSLSSSTFRRAAAAPSGGKDENGLPDTYESGFWNDENAQSSHYFELNPNAEYPGEKEVPLQWIITDEAMGPDIDETVDPKYALVMLGGALTVMAGIAFTAGSLAPECPVSPRILDEKTIAVSYGWADPE